MARIVCDTLGNTVTLSGADVADAYRSSCAMVAVTVQAPSPSADSVDPEMEHLSPPVATA